MCINDWGQVTRVITMEEAISLGLIANPQSRSSKTSGLPYWLSLVLLAIASVSLAAWLTKKRLMGDSPTKEN